MAIVEMDLDILRGLQRDAERYRFLRDEDKWGEDSGNDCWLNLGEAHGDNFDEIVDSRISKAADD